MKNSKLTKIFLEYNRDKLRLFKRYSKEETDLMIKYLRQQLKDLDLQAYISIRRKKSYICVHNLTENGINILPEWSFFWILKKEISEDFIYSLLRIKNLIK